MTALPSHLPAFSFFGGSLFFLRWPFFVPLLSPPLPASKLSFSSAVLFFPSGGLSRPAAVFLFSPASFFFLRRFSFPLRQPFSFRCCFLLFPPANFLFLRRFSFSPPAAFLVPLPFFFSLLQAFSFFGGSLFPSAVFLVPQRFSSVFFRVGAFRPPLFRGLKYCKRSDKKRRPPLYAEAACQVPVAPGKCACRGRARRSPEIGPKPEVCSFDRRDGAQNRENELPARKRRLRAHGSLMW